MPRRNLSRHSNATPALANRQATDPAIGTRHSKPKLGPITTTPPKACWSIGQEPAERVTCPQGEKPGGGFESNDRRAAGAQDDGRRTTDAPQAHRTKDAAKRLNDDRRAAGSPHFLLFTFYSALPRSGHPSPSARARALITDHAALRTPPQATPELVPA
jgi:hypothetical protein